MSKLRLKKKLLKQSMSDLVTECLNALSQFNVRSNCDESSLKTVDAIVQKISVLDIISEEGLNAYQLIESLSKYDSTLVSCSISPYTNRREYTSKIENLTKLYTGLLRYIPYNNTHSIDLVFKHSCEREAFILLKAVTEVYQMPSFGNIVVELMFDYNLTRPSIEKVMKFYNIDIKKLKWPSRLFIEGTTENLKSVTFVIQKLLSIWVNDPARAADLLDLFVRQGISINECSLEENAINVVLSDSLDTTVNLGLLEKLLQNGADVNLSLRGRNIVNPLFGNVVGKGSIEAVQLLLNYGANPYLSSQGSKNVGSTSGSNVLPSFGLNGVMPDPYDRAVYLIKISKLIEQALLDRMLGTAPKPVYIKHEPIIETHASSDDSWGEIRVLPKNSKSDKAPNKKKLKAHKFNQKQDSNIIKYSDPDAENLLDDSKISVQDIATSINEKAVIVNSTVESANVLSQEQVDAKLAYIQHAAIMANDSNISEEEKLTYRFDSLLLQGSVEGLQALLECNPELHGYSVSTLLRHGVSDNLAHDVLAYNPALLHKFCILKKQSNESKSFDCHSNDSKTFVEGVFEVASAFGNKVFVKISDQVMCELELCGGNSKLDKLGFVSPNSTGQNGIKVYNNGIKLKLGRTDKAAYTNKQYVDKNGDILIIFNKIFNHKSWSKVRGGLETIDVTNSQLDAEVYKDYACNNESNGVDASPFNYSSDEDNDSVDVMGDI